MSTLKGCLLNRDFVKKLVLDRILMENIFYANIIVSFLHLYIEIDAPNIGDEYLSLGDKNLKIYDFVVSYCFD